MKTQVSLNCLCFHLLKDMEMSFNNSLFKKAFIGLSSGSLGIILVVYSVNVAPNIIIDFRYIPLLLTATYIGWFPTILSAIIVGGFRILYFGISEPAVIDMLNILLVGIGFSLIANLKTSRKSKWVYSLIYLFSVTSIAFHIIQLKTL